MSTRPSAHRRGYTRAWQAIAAEAIRRQPWCTDCGATDDLTGDHEIPLARGGLSTLANCTVRCRGCNTRKRDRLAESVQLGLDLAAGTATAIVNAVRRRLDRGAH